MASFQIDTNTRPDPERRSIVMNVRFRQNATTPKLYCGKHALYQITANLYDSAMSVEKREAQSGVIRLVRPVPQPVPGRVMVKSKCLILQCPRRLARPRTSPFHGGNTGSNPVGDANKIITPRTLLFRRLLARQENHSDKLRLRCALHRSDGLCVRVGSHFVVRMA